MTILLPVLLVAAVGLLCGILLTVAARLMAMPVDERVEAVLEALPGTNCGACGFSGCAGYAEELAGGSAANGLCAPGGADAADAAADILGLPRTAFVPNTAFVRCGGSDAATASAFAYTGERSCAAAVQLHGGYRACPYACLGFGDCAGVCTYDAICVVDGTARIDPARCRACATCVAACPKGLIQILYMDSPKTAVRCRNPDKGTAKICRTGCIGCRRCMGACESGAITVPENLAEIDPALCTGCGACTQVCPTKCIVKVIIT
ncbi:MAG: RnfABCDGE type electron transport complex subunit B [Oscillospiraceae bacterium]|nr:RnfABCDGE type electron transport complex subunit B [Oscillospiraceae bacterium]